MEQDKIIFNEHNYKLLVKEYKIAVEKSLQTFMCFGREFYTPYAKYLIEYLKPNFEK